MVNSTLHLVIVKKILQKIRKSIKKEFLSRNFKKIIRERNNTLRIKMKEKKIGLMRLKIMLSLILIRNLIHFQ